MPDPLPDALEAARALDTARPVGVLVPPANPVVEPELRCLLPPGLALFASRLRVLPGDLRARNLAYVEAYPAALAGFGELSLRAVVVGMTGPSYRLGAHGDAALAAELSTPGTPVQTASGAILAALRALGAGRIALLSPYPPWLTDEAAAYFAAAGLTVAAVAAVAAGRHPYALGTGDVLEALRHLPADVDAVVLSGTGMLTLPALLRVPAAVPMLSSNICCAWWLLRTAGTTGPAHALRAVAPALHRTLPPPDPPP